MAVSMSQLEFGRLDVLLRVQSGRLRVADACQLLDLQRRQVFRLLRGLKQDGSSSVLSKRRDKPSNNRLPVEIRTLALTLVRERYPDFGPTLALEKLAAHHGLCVSRETLRGWMIADGLWIDRRQRLPSPHQPRRAADIMAAINAIHAFREGNGRTQRAFIRALAKAAGHTLDFTVISQERMIQASIAANEREAPSIMWRLFADATNPARIAALRRVIAFFVRQEYRWNDHYVATLDPGHAVELTMAGSAGDQFMARTGAEILIGQTSDLPSPIPARGEVFVYEGHTPWA